MPKKIASRKAKKKDQTWYEVGIDCGEDEGTKTISGRIYNKKVAIELYKRKRDSYSRNPTFEGEVFLDRWENGPDGFSIPVETIRPKENYGPKKPPEQITVGEPNNTYDMVTHLVKRLQHIRQEAELLIKYVPEDLQYIDEHDGITNVHQGLANIAICADLTDQESDRYGYYTPNLSQNGEPIANIIAEMLSEADGETASYIVEKGLQEQWLLRALFLKADSETLMDLLEERGSLNTDSDSAIDRIYKAVEEGIEIKSQGSKWNYKNKIERIQEDLHKIYNQLGEL